MRQETIVNGIGGACGSRQTAPTARKRGPGGKATVELDLASIRQGEGVCARKGGRGGLPGGSNPAVERAWLETILTPGLSEVWRKLDFHF
jgi:hypothetical protein